MHIAIEADPEVKDSFAEELFKMHGQCRVGTIDCMDVAQEHAPALLSHMRKTAFKKNLNAAYKVWSEFLEKLKAKTKKMKKERVDEKKRKHPRYRPPRKDPKTGKYDNPCGKGFKPGAQTGVLTKVGPQSGRRVSNCEPIKKKKNEAVLEAVIKRLLNED